MQLVLLISTLLSFISALLAAPMCGLVPPSKSQSTINTKSPGNSSLPEDVIAAAWLPGWKSNLNLDSIPWKSYTHLTFSFATTTNDTSMFTLDNIDKTLFQNFISRAHSEGVGAFLSIGGWTGSMFYSQLVQPSNQAAFVKAIVDVANQYNLDGIDFDWEYPNKQGVGCNIISPDDSKNFLSFLQQLRKDPTGSKLKLSAAVGLTPFAGPDGTPMSDVSDFGDALDLVAIMAYDIWGSWSSTAGPNAPLQDSCAPQPEGSAASAVKAWTNAKFPAEKLVLGIPAYGHSFSVLQSVAIQNNNVMMYPTFNKAFQPPGEGETNTTTTSTGQCGSTVTTGPSGIWNFEGLISAGFLQNNNGDVSPASGVVRMFDSCSQTPFLYDPITQVLISYDDPQSMAAKGQFINENGLAGFSMWDVTGDTKGLLVNAVSDAMGIEQICDS